MKISTYGTAETCGGETAAAAEASCGLTARLARWRSRSGAANLAGFLFGCAQQALTCAAVQLYAVRRATPYCHYRPFNE